MKTMGRAVTALLAGSMLLAFATTSDAANETVETSYVAVKQGEAELKSGEVIDLQNTYTHSSLTYKHQGSLGGINLGWGPTGTASVTFEKQGAGHGTVLHFGDTVAMRVRAKDEGDWVKYEERRFGINLGWSKSPVYEWKIAGGPAGQPVKMGQPIALLNSHENDSMIYCWRVTGAWLRWSKTCGQKERLITKGHTSGLY